MKIATWRRYVGHATRRKLHEKERKHLFETENNDRFADQMGVLGTNLLKNFGVVLPNLWHTTRPSRSRSDSTKRYQCDATSIPNQKGFKSVLVRLLFSFSDHGGGVNLYDLFDRYRSLREIFIRNK